MCLAALGLLSSDSPVASYLYLNLVGSFAGGGCCDVACLVGMWQCSGMAVASDFIGSGAFSHLSARGKGVWAKQRGSIPLPFEGRHLPSLLSSVFGVVVAMLFAFSGELGLRAESVSFACSLVGCQWWYGASVNASLASDANIGGCLSNSGRGMGSRTWAPGWTNVGRDPISACSAVRVWCFRPCAGTLAPGLREAPDYAPGGSGGWVTSCGWRRPSRPWDGALLNF